MSRTRNTNVMDDDNADNVQQKWTHEERVAFITLDRSSKRNAFDSVLLNATRDAVASVGQGESIRLVVLKSACEGVFSAGADLREMAALDASTAGAFITRIHAVCQAIVDCPIPVIAVIDGVCVGAALEIAASCDLRIATDRARFAMPEVLVGLPSVVEAARLPQLIGFGRTRRLLYTGETIDARIAQQWGLIEYQCQHEQLDATESQVVEQLLSTAPDAMRLQKSLIRSWEQQSLDEGIATGINTFEDAFKSPEPQQWLSRQARALGKSSS